MNNILLTKEIYNDLRNFAIAKYGYHNGQDILHEMFVYLIEKGRLINKTIFNVNKSYLLRLIVLISNHFRQRGKSIDGPARRKHLITSLNKVVNSSEGPIQLYNLIPDPRIDIYSDFLLAEFSAIGGSTSGGKETKQEELELF